MRSEKEQDEELENEWQKRLGLAMGAAIGFIPIGSALIRELGLDAVPFFAGALAVGAAVTRALTIPAVRRAIVEYAPWLHSSAVKRKDDSE